MEDATMRTFAGILGVLIIVYGAAATTVLSQSRIGREVAISRHLQDGEEFALSLRELLAHGERLFTAAWTIEEGGGRPLTKGTGAKLSDPSSPVEIPRNFNRVCRPDADSRALCHDRAY